MLHISICDDERIAVEKMQRIVENVLEQEQLPAKLETFENGEEFLQQYVIRDDEVVILVTAYDNLALKTFSYGPFQIVRKEQMEEDLPKAIGRFLNIRKRNQEELEFRIKGELIHVKLEDIVYFEKYKHQVYVHLADQTVLTVRENMQDFEKELAGKGFVRTHAAYIVALRYCRKFEKNDIVLEGDVKVPVSRERRQMAKEQFMISRRR